MKRKTYKVVSFLFAAFFISSLHAQKFDKKITENFKVNKDVVVAIDASNANIDVTTWNRNEVVVDAVITVEGLTKKEAEKFLKSWKFEALGNKSKVQIKANANQFLHFDEKDFTFNIGDFNFSDFEIPEINFEDFNIEIPEIDFESIEAIELPEMDFDFQNIWNDIDDEEFDGDKKTFSFISKGKNKTIVIKSKEEWERFKKSDDFKELKKSLKVSLERVKERYSKFDKEKMRDEINKAKIEVKKIDKDKNREEINKARLAYKNVDKQKIKESIEKAKVSIQKMKLKYENSYMNGNNIIIIENDKNKKEVKVTRKITIKVPKDATFDLNTRHSKVKLPKGKTSGKVSYGTFNSEGLNGGKLNISYSPVTIADLNACTLFLNNVTDAKIASVTNSKLDTNSSGIVIQNIFENVDVTNKFGELTINNIDKNYKTFNLLLNYSDANINLANINEKISFDIGDKSQKSLNKPSISFNLDQSKTKDINGNFFIMTKNKSFLIEGKYSHIVIKE